MLASGVTVRIAVHERHERVSQGFDLEIILAQISRQVRFADVKPRACCAERKARTTPSSEYVRRQCLGA